LPCGVPGAASPRALEASEPAPHPGRREAKKISVLDQLAKSSFIFAILDLVTRQENIARQML